MYRRECSNMFILFIILYLAVVIKAANFPVNKPVSSQKQIKRHNSTKIETPKSEAASTNPDTLDDGLESHNESAYDTPFDLPRFVQSKDEDGKQTKEDLMAIAASELTRDEAMVKAQRKRSVASLLRKAAERARSAPVEPGSAAGTQKKSEVLKGNLELTNEDFQAIANERRADVLEFEALLLDGKVKTYNKLVADAKVDATGFPICDMLKIGPLQFVTTFDEIRHRIDNTVMGQMDGKILTILRRKRPKMTYAIRSIQLPIYSVADSGETCFGFNYHGVDQVFCTVNELSRNSWIDALSEAWFCHNEGLQGTLPSIQATEEAMRTKKRVKKPKAAKKAEKVEESLLDINIGLDPDGNPKVTANGKDLIKKKK